MQYNYDQFIFTGRGTTALWLILKNLPYKNRKILLPVNICEILIPIIYRANFKPCFYDVNQDTGNASIDNINDKYTGNESVLLAVHNFGIPLKIDKISKWCMERNIFLIEDVCNSLGGYYIDNLLGNWGDAAIFSFGFNKIIENGIGGALIIKNNEFKAIIEKELSILKCYSSLHREKDNFFQNKLRNLRTQNNKQNPSAYIPLYKAYSPFLLYNIDNKTKSDILTLAKNLQTNLETRKRKATRYRNEIKSTYIFHLQEVPGQIYWRYNILVKNNKRDYFLKELFNNGLFASTWYPPIIELFQTEYNEKEYQGSITFSKRIINLFVDHRISDDDITKTVTILNKYR